MFSIHCFTLLSVELIPLLSLLSCPPTSLVKTNDFHRLCTYSVFTTLFLPRNLRGQKDPRFHFCTINSRHTHRAASKAVFSLHILIQKHHKLPFYWFLYCANTNSYSWCVDLQYLANKPDCDSEWEEVWSLFTVLLWALLGVCRLPWINGGQDNRSAVSRQSSRHAPDTTGPILAELEGMLMDRSHGTRFDTSSQETIKDCCLPLRGGSLLVSQGHLLSRRYCY